MNRLHCQQLDCAEADPTPHNLVTGEKIRIFSEDGDLSENLEEDTIYYAVVIDNVRFEVASTESDALKGETITVYGGTGLRVESRVSDKAANEIGCPILYDPNHNNWFIHVEEDNELHVHNMYNTYVSYMYIFNQQFLISCLTPQLSTKWIFLQFDERKSLDVIPSLPPSQTMKVEASQRFGLCLQTQFQVTKELSSELYSMQVSLRITHGSGCIQPRPAARRCGCYRLGHRWERPGCGA